MIDTLFLAIFQDVILLVLIVFLVLGPLILLWTFTLLDLFVRRDIRWRKVLWFIFIIFTPILG